MAAKAGDLAGADLAEAEGRIIGDADKGHAAIGKSIDRLDSGLAALGEKISRLARKADAVKGAVADAREDLAALRRAPDRSDAPFADRFGGRQVSCLGSLGPPG